MESASLGRPGGTGAWAGGATSPQCLAQQRGAPAPPAPEHPWDAKLSPEELSLQLIQEPNLTAPSTPEPHLPWHNSTDVGEWM